MKEESLRLCRALSPQGLLGPYAKQNCSDEGVKDTAQGAATARLALEDLELLDTRLAGLDCTLRWAKEDAHHMCTIAGVFLAASV